MLMFSTSHKMLTHVSFLLTGLATLQKKAHQFHEISSRLHRRECLALRAPATALLDAIVGELSVLDTVSKKLITFSTGADFEVCATLENCVSGRAWVPHRGQILPSWLAHRWLVCRSCAECVGVCSMVCAPVSRWIVCV